MKETDVDLHLIPVPADFLDAEAARRWLSESAPGYADLLGDALHEGDKKTRGACSVLAMDFMTLLRGCARALDGERIEVTAYPSSSDDIDFPSTVHELARITSFRVQEDTAAAYAQDELRTELLRRLDLVEGSSGCDNEDGEDTQ